MQHRVSIVIGLRVMFIVWGHVFCFDRTANAHASIAPTSSILHHSPSALLSKSNQSTLAWSRQQNHLLFYVGALVQVPVTVTAAFDLNCRLCLDRSSASESTCIHQLRVETHATRPSLRPIAQPAVFSRRGGLKEGTSRGHQLVWHIDGYSYNL